MLPHTVVVDFAVALLLTSVGADVLSMLAEEDEFRVVATWTLVFGTGAAIFAALSGYAAYDDAAPTGLAEAVILNHRNAGLVTLACFVPASVMAATAARARPREARDRLLEPRGSSARLPCW